MRFWHIFIILFFITWAINAQVVGYIYNDYENEPAQFHPLNVYLSDGTSFLLFTDNNGYFNIDNNNVSLLRTFGYYNHQLIDYQIVIKKTAVVIDIKHQKDEYPDTFRVSGFLYNTYTHLPEANYPVTFYPDTSINQKITVYTNPDGEYHFTLTLPQNYNSVGNIQVKGFCSQWNIYNNYIPVKAGNYTRDIEFCNHIEQGYRYITLYGTVYDSLTLEPVDRQDIYISIGNDDFYTVKTNQDGYYSIDLQLDTSVHFIEMNIYTFADNSIKNYSKNINIREHTSLYNVDFYINRDIREIFDYTYNIEPDNTVIFYAIEQSSTPSEYFMWNFGDNYHSGGKVVMHKYDTAGFYLVTLRTNTNKIKVKGIYIGNQTNSISGNVYAKNYLLPLGTISLYYKYKSTYILYDNITVRDGNFCISNIPNGDYICMAYPSFEIDTNYFPHYLPTYYPQVDNWISAEPITVDSQSQSIDIHLLYWDVPYFGQKNITGKISTNTDKLYVEPTEYVLTLYNSDIQPIDLKVVKNNFFEFKHLKSGIYYLLLHIPSLNYKLVKIDLRNNNTINVIYQISQDTIDAITNVLYRTTTPKINIYPNPFSEKINISGISAGTVEIYSLTGRLISRKDFNVPEVKLNNLSTGVYILKLYSDSQIFVKLMQKIP